MAYDTPLYVREHTKKHLEAALHNDSLFLANQKIMDYSLIVGVDKDSLELVVGIIGERGFQFTRLQSLLTLSPPLSSLTFNRLSTTVHLGQATRDMGQGDCLHRRR